MLDKRPEPDLDIDGMIEDLKQLERTIRYSPYLEANNTWFANQLREVLEKHLTNS